MAILTPGTVNGGCDKRDSITSKTHHQPLPSTKCRAFISAVSPISIKNVRMDGSERDWLC